MKTFFLILVMVFIITPAISVQPARKPFIQIKIDGKPFKNGDVLTVDPGRKLVIGVELEGGRRDFCKFPDTYADIAKTSQILARGDNGLTYQLDGVKCEWKLLNEEIRFSSDEFAVVSPTTDQSTAGISISNAPFSQTFVKVTIKAVWQFSQEGKTEHEENIAEATVYFKVAGASDVWFSSRYVQAAGIKNERIQEKLQEVQSVCDSIDLNFHRLNFPAVQQCIRNLQNSVNTLKSVIDEVKADNPAFRVKVAFIGLPSDDPYKDITTLLAIKTEWESLEPLVNDLKQQLGTLPEKQTRESKDELARLIGIYAGWQNKLPENTFTVLPTYISDLKAENIRIPENIFVIDGGKAVSNYSQTLNDFNAWLDLRIQQVPDEIQKINSTQSRLQAVRLFDGMLRSYFSSINWAEWKDTRE